MLTHLPQERFRCYLSEDIDTIWPYVEPFIQRALDRGSDYTTKQVHEGLNDKTMQLWTYQKDHIEAVLITKIQDGYCLMLALGGSGMKIWKHWAPIVEAWARDQGCYEMRIYGRRGWSRVFGYTIDYTRMSKAL